MIIARRIISLVLRGVFFPGKVGGFSGHGIEESFRDERVLLGTMALLFSTYDDGTWSPSFSRT